MNTPADILIVGGSASGLSTVESLRRKEYEGKITVLGGESHAPYDRPPLSKQILSGAWSADKATLRTTDHLEKLNATFIVGDHALSLDSESRTVRTESGRILDADAIVVATGARPRTLSGQEGMKGVHVLRTLDDSLALRTELRPGVKLVVVGEGVLGCEIAATAATMGADVTICGPQPAPMTAQVGPLVADLLAALHAERGIHLRLSSGVDGLTQRDGRVTGVQLSTGETLDADVVVVAIGAVLATEWLDGSGLVLDNGVVCDSRCRAADGIYAVGDIARWKHEKLDKMVRLENRTNATEQAAAVAAVIMGEDEPYVPVPYFWTDQFDVKLQVYGFLPKDADVDIVEGDTAAGRFVARYTTAGTVTGVLGWNMPKQARQHRQDIVDSMA
ncbi:FAD-dependent oxidoreductase [Rhodococcoides fascians A25f]|uniref:NAD(P)/FAD-dependent oxidoreductase n=1 Tax=Rhodococcoides fascians TaxID=1828 RepID=UPI000561ACB3|nr:FAD-dependent oxidoreductase [Rhodococcus fascians]QII07374.1 FAD-dependent oxidoreductase [Rhodococcus fascians A25f]